MLDCARIESVALVQTLRPWPFVRAGGARDARAAPVDPDRGEERVVELRLVGRTCCVLEVLCAVCKHVPDD